MKKQIEKIRQSIADESVEQEPQEISIDLAVVKIMSWLLHNFLPAIFLALAIDLTIMFTVPVEVAMSRWFWIKDPVSIGTAYLICKLSKLICRHSA